mgnify:CR=1 FL=1|tara:strand:+ start:11531 stop:12388 length:858 start_codon:yes stop_codon:yes gene_type:complete
MTLIIGYDNRIAEATITAGSSAAGRGPEWTQDRDMDESWQSAGVTAAETWLEITFPEPVPLAILGAHGCNNSRFAEYRWRGWADPAKTNQLHDTGWLDHCPPMIPFSQRDWADQAFWTGRPIERNWSIRPRSIVSVMDQKHRLSVARLEVKDTSLTAGFWNVSRLFAGTKLATAVGVDLGSETGLRPTSQTQKSRSGKRRVQEGIPARRAKMTFSWLTGDERAVLIDLLDRTGDTGEILWLPDASDPVAIQREAYLATIFASRPIRRARNSDEPYSFEAEIEEWL